MLSHSCTVAHPQMLILADTDLLAVKDRSCFIVFADHFLYSVMNQEKVSYFLDYKSPGVRLIVQKTRYSCQEVFFFNGPSDLHSDY